MITCTACEQELSEDCFYRGHHQKTCKICVQKRNAESRKRNPDSVRRSIQERNESYKQPLSLRKITLEQNRRNKEIKKKMRDYPIRRPVCFGGMSTI